jgi:ubiquitin carboxyl-terminal hydrolase MINDY-3/4
VTSCCGHYGIIFNSNRELLRNYHAEKRFELHHYTCSGCHISMTVDNRGQDESDGHRMLRDGNDVSAYRAMEKREEMIATPLERLIHTKWESAKITFHGPAPPSLNF